MRSSAQIINFREQAKKRPVESVGSADATGVKPEKNVEAMNDLNQELAHLIKELGRHIPNYVRI